jgi:hypothetical protein
MTDRKDIKAFTSGVHNLINDELIPNDAASDSLGWLTKDGKIELMYGRQAQGAEGAAGAVIAEHTGYKVDGTAVRFRKVSNGSTGKIQYLNGSTWTDVITGLGTGEVTFSNYASLAGNSVYITDPVDGLYKIMTANPGSYSDVYLSTKSFKGFSLIDKGRMFMWGVTKDPTGLYGSYIDAQNSTVYTTVTGEVTASTSGTLAFKAGGARRTCFGVSITITSGGQVYTDNYNGILTGSAGGTGTINYTTGEWTVSAGGAGTATYQWEDSSAKGVTDFSKSSPRLAGEGFILRQDQGGDAIETVIPLDGAYFSFKTRSVYQLTMDAEDTDPINELFRTDIGIKTNRSAIGTSTGIVFLNTGNPTRPMLNILQRNPVGDNFTTQPLFAQFKFQDYNYDSAVLESWDKYAIVSCRYDSNFNNRLLMCDMMEKTVDIAPYGGSAFTKANGYLYMGDPVAQTSYEMFTGFDDMGSGLVNYWVSKGDLLESESLKKVKRLRFKGEISPDQAVKVYLSYDNSEFQHIGTILGSGDYVDYTASYAIGTSMLGTSTLGGDDEAAVYSYLMEIKLRMPKFRKRTIRLEATGIGYVSFQMITDYDIWQYESKLPKQYRLKQNVSIDGLTTNLDTPE